MTLDGFVAHLSDLPQVCDMPPMVVVALMGYHMLGDETAIRSLCADAGITFADSAQSAESAPSPGGCV